VEAPISVASKEQEIALQTFRQAQFQMMSNAAMSFWDTYVAERRVEMRRRSVEIARTVLNDEQERLRFGRSSETRVASADAAVAQRQVQLFAAEQEVVQTRSDMRTFVAGLEDDAKLDIDPNVSLIRQANVPDRMTALEKAFQFRPEYIASKIRADKEDVRIKFAKNNRLPQLDLIASYGINGLSDSFSNSWADAWSKDYETMYAGIEFKMLLGGNKRAKSELTAAQLRKHQALLEIRAAEVSIHTSVDTALHNLATALKQVRAMEGIVRTNERLLEVEMSRYQAGQSNSREVLEIEERLNDAKETLIESQANLQKAMIGLSLAEGTLLRNYDLES
jgi:outer membrane protein TolC